MLDPSSIGLNTRFLHFQAPYHPDATVHSTGILHGAGRILFCFGYSQWNGTKRKREMVEQLHFLIISLNDTYIYIYSVVDMTLNPRLNVNEPCPVQGMYLRFC